MKLLPLLSLLPFTSLAAFLVIDPDGYLINTYSEELESVRSFENARGNRTVWFTDPWVREVEETVETLPPEPAPPREPDTVVVDPETGDITFIPAPEPVAPEPVTRVTTRTLAPIQIRTPEAEAAWRAAKAVEAQAAKPLERKVYENQFFGLIEELYNVTGVTNQVTPKLGFPEIQSLIETVQATDPMGAVNYSLKLLSIDAALKRYDTLWWDDAIEHTLPEE